MEPTSSLTPWLGPWTLAVPSGNPIATGFYSSDPHHAVIFDWHTLSESGQEIVMERFSKVFKQAVASGLVPLGVVSLEPLATPFDAEPREGLLMLSGTKVVWMAHDALQPTVFALSDSLETLGLERRQPRDLDAATAAKDRANGFLQKGEFENAAAAYRDAIFLCPDYARPYNNLGRSYSMQGDHRTADALFRMAIRVDPNEANAMICLATLLNKLRRKDEALAWVQRADKTNPKTPADAADVAKLLKQLNDAVTGGQ